MASFPLTMNIFINHIFPYEYIHYSHFPWVLQLIHLGLSVEITIFVFPLTPFSFHFSLVTHVSRSRVIIHDQYLLFIHSQQTINIFTAILFDQFFFASLYTISLLIHTSPHFLHPRSHCALSLSLFRVVLIYAQLFNSFILLFSFHLRFLRPSRTFATLTQSHNIKHQMRQQPQPQ